MIELQHLAEPNELIRYRKLNPGSLWDDPAFGSVRPTVRRQLNLEQEGLCVYCESKLDPDEGHVEHIKSRDENRALAFVYGNLAHSCNGFDHCGRIKDNAVLPVEPRPGCNRFFVLMAVDGRLVSASGLTSGEGQQATDTLRILGLNVVALSWQRKGFADATRFLSAEDREAFIATVPFRWLLRGF